jgi:hypothetical protein
MKRGLITWDKTEIPPAVFETRLHWVRSLLSAKNLQAAVVYSELWRSNSARFLSNYMPYFNRAFLIVPADQPVTLLCGLSPRVHGWIRSVTPIEDVRSAGNFAKPLFQLASEHGWSRIGVYDYSQLPYDLYQLLQAGPLEIIDIHSAELFSDESELSLRRKAVTLAREILEAELPSGVGRTDHEFVGRLERRFRGAGAEDLITLVTNGRSVPAPASGQRLLEHFSVSIALEYRGHWVRISRSQGAGFDPDMLRREFLHAATPPLIENLSGPYPYECVTRRDLGQGSIFAVHASRPEGAKQIYIGDTFWFGPSGPEIL